jgi:hypothetical protein
MIRRLSACLLAAAMCIAPTALGGVLYERSLMVDRSANIFATELFDLEFVLGNAVSGATNPVKLFDDVSITPSSVNSIYKLLPADSRFQPVADRISDGLDQFVRLTLTEAASGRSELRGWQESKFFLGHGSTQVPDLSGSTVEAVQLRIDEFRLLHPSPLALLPSGPQVKLLMTFTVLGTTIPEPSTLALGALGLAAMGRTVYTGSRRRR